MGSPKLNGFGVLERGLVGVSVRVDLVGTFVGAGVGKVAFGGMVVGKLVLVGRKEKEVLVG